MVFVHQSLLFSILNILVFFLSWVFDSYYSLLLLITRCCLSLCCIVCVIVLDIICYFCSLFSLVVFSSCSSALIIVCHFYLPLSFVSALYSLSLCLSIFCPSLTVVLLPSHDFNMCCSNKMHSVEQPSCLSLSFCHALLCTNLGTCHTTGASEAKQYQGLRVREQGLMITNQRLFFSSVVFTSDLTLRPGPVSGQYSFDLPRIYSPSVRVSSKTIGNEVNCSWIFCIFSLYVALLWPSAATTLNWIIDYISHSFLW